MDYNLALIKVWRDLAICLYNNPTNLQDNMLTPRYLLYLFTLKELFLSLYKLSQLFFMNDLIFSDKKLIATNDFYLTREWKVY